MLTLGMLQTTSAGGGGGGGGNGVLSYLGSSSVTTNSGTHTYTNFNIGTAAADRLIVVFIAHSGAMDVSSVTIAGGAGTEVSGTAATSGDTKGIIYQRLVTTGTTATIVVNSNRDMATSTIHVYAITGLSSTTAEDATRDQSGAMSQGLTNTSGAIVIAGAAQVGVADYSYTWIGVTKDAEAYSEQLNSSSASIITSAANVTVGYTSSGGADETMSVAAWY